MWLAENKKRRAGVLLLNRPPVTLSASVTNWCAGRTARTAMILARDYVICLQSAAELQFFWMDSQLFRIHCDAGLVVGGMDAHGNIASVASFAVGRAVACVLSPRAFEKQLKRDADAVSQQSAFRQCFAYPCRCGGYG